VGIAGHAALPVAAAAAPDRAMGLITLITWLLTASIGAYMFGTLTARGGLQRQRAVRDGLPPVTLFGHFSLALTALVVWVSYVATGWAALAWTAVGLLMPAIGLGIATVTLWTPYPHLPAARADTASGPLTAGDMATAVSDEVLTTALTDDALAGRLVDQVIAGASRGAERKPPGRPGGPAAVIIPVTHGVAAVATFALAVVTAASTR
jgi:hypothetical protein